MRERRLRVVRALGCASDADLVARLSQHDRQALQEMTHRHEAALSVLACAILRQPKCASDAVADVYATVWAEPARLDTRTSVRAQLAALVLDRCRTMEPDGAAPVPFGTRHLRARDPVARSRERIAVALIAFGDHTCQQAAELVGSRPASVADQLRGFVLDPEHFDAFYASADGVFARRNAPPRR